jgi:hypothetical protein
LSVNLRNISNRIVALQEKVKLPTRSSVVLDCGEFLSQIQMRSGGEIKTFSMYQLQKLLIELIKRYPNVTIVKTRQVGVTQIVLGLMLHNANINPAYVGCIFTRGDKDAEKLSLRLKNLSKQSDSILKKDTNNHFVYENNAEILIYNTGKEGSRGVDSACTMAFDEMAFVPNIASIYSASTASTTLLGNKARIINISTPSGQSGFYWKLLNEDNNTGKTIEQICQEVAEQKLYSDNLPGFYWFEDYSGNCKVFIHWRCHPVYKDQDNFVETMQKRYKLSDEAAQREYNLVFLDPAIQVFQPDIITKSEFKFDFDIKEQKICYAGIYHSDLNTALIVIDDDGYVIDFYKENSLDSKVVFDTLECVRQKHFINSIAIKSANGGKTIAQEIRKIHSDLKVIEVKNSEFADAITGLQIAMRKQLIHIPKYSRKKDPPIAKELRDFRLQNNKYGAVDGERDEYVWALAFAVMASENGAKRLPFGSG